jgi:acetyl-CoA C-acetyltransferase
MPDAVIVSTARRPIGRAFKGSFVECRSDDLAATAVRAALEKVPELPPDSIDDLILGCSAPTSEQGGNLARTVAVLLGLRNVPGVTVNRFCASSLQAIRMAVQPGLRWRRGADEGANGRNSRQRTTQQSASETLRGLR